MYMYVYRCSRLLGYCGAKRGIHYGSDSAYGTTVIVHALSLDEESVRLLKERRTTVVDKFPNSRCGFKEYILFCDSTEDEVLVLSSTTKNSEPAIKSHESSFIGSGNPPYEYAYQYLLCILYSKSQEVPITHF